MTDPDATWDSTLTLLTRAREGDAQALVGAFDTYSVALESPTASSWISATSRTRLLCNGAVSHPKECRC